MASEKQKKYTLEVCTASLNSVMHAVAGGAERVELCSALSLDGLTPSVGLLATIRKMYPQLKIHVLVRPREGNFVYTEEELRVMERDIEAALPYADAIVSGALDAQGNIDVAATRRLMAASQGKPFTFHRAFDVCNDAQKALNQLMEMGCARLLTSGLKPTAEEGSALIRKLVERAGNRLIVMPGGGVNPDNARCILEATGAKEIHSSASSLHDNGLKETSATIVRSLLENIRI
ncbi:MAG: copper homeostasis protein CutC [Prevotellaceae bacterium]|nr:copper homeostasis protein CutC [Prevotella sp.]MDD7258049.1 copper homeostasis protein CutC [Prevotellaceae bacterium]MDY6130088.1 copper homeostasis protein CutC [Prevotella sp.]